MVSKIRSCLFLLLLCATACGDSTEPDANAHDAGDEETPSSDACEHMIGGPQQSLTAAAESDTAPSFGETHNRYDITMPDDVGFVAIEVAEETEMHFFFDTNVGLTLTDSAGTELAVEEEIDAVADCEEVVAGHVFDLAVGTFNLRIESTEQTVSLVPVSSDHEHEDE